MDALIPSGHHLLILDLALKRYQRWDLAHPCGLADTLLGDWAAAPHWLSLAAPGTPFQPIRAATGPSGHFYLLDRIGRRLALYDTNAQFLSAFPLPAEIVQRNLEHLQVHWTRDGIFTFLDLSEGSAWQFAEIRTGAGKGDWRLISRIRLPLNLEACLWEPYFRNPCCRVRSGPSSAPGGRPTRTQCFDRYFNPTDSVPPGTDSTLNLPPPSGFREAGLRAHPDPGGPGWIVAMDPGICAGRPRVGGCFHPEKGRFHRCFESPGAAGPALP